MIVSHVAFLTRLRESCLLLADRHLSVVLGITVRRGISLFPCAIVHNRMIIVVGYELLMIHASIYLLQDDALDLTITILPLSLIYALCINSIKIMDSV